MPHVHRIETEDGLALRWGSEGASYGYDHEDSDSLVVALVKAVNDGIESEDIIEGEVAQAVAEILKAEDGAVVWGAEDGYKELQSDVAEAMPESADGEYQYIEDIALDKSKALVCYSKIGEMGAYYVVPLTWNGDQCIVSPKTGWIEVEREEQYTAKDRILRALREPGSTEKGREAEGDLDYIVTKSQDEMRYTLGPLYAPNRKDAQGEYVKDEELHKAVIAYVEESADNGRRLNLQHGDMGDVTVGSWVEVMRWPYEHVIKMRTVDGEERELTMPEGTIYMGVKWDEDAWPLVKSGKLNGYSLGGTAVRVNGGAMDEHMGDKHAARKLEAMIDAEVPSNDRENALELLRIAADEAVRLRKNEHELVAEERKQREEDRRAQIEERVMLREAIDALKAAASRDVHPVPPAGETHIHLPEQNVTINEPEDRLSQLLHDEE